ncbi:hypothetical protein DFH09DRAFT_1171668 [Mycena vulgaris]|nr:hypothetical protein DFH09DRAFT_1171668 [Mycena vulgaris]
MGRGHRDRGFPAQQREREEDRAEADEGSFNAIEGWEGTHQRATYPTSPSSVKWPRVLNPRSPSRARELIPHRDDPPPASHPHDPFAYPTHRIAAITGHRRRTPARAPPPRCAYRGQAALSSRGGSRGSAVWGLRLKAMAGTKWAGTMPGGYSGACTRRRPRFHVAADVDAGG